MMMCERPGTWYNSMFFLGTESLQQTWKLFGFVFGNFVSHASGIWNSTFPLRISAGIHMIQYPSQNCQKRTHNMEFTSTVRQL